ncbi:uncharacterized protein EV154DRAFT_488378 [Mucor mucedo]|uniref:uncharacterized protein n=1 Tax=Mucor mucedo TaxID=29922 RepID=UPI00221E4C36|nr:uncharacterized protein EV154DRAFT_488378 [Mucor mucedo]KAI7867220.1 hypothetical protein EV154DRAFT_488378 [Mucor mucedo]
MSNHEKIIEKERIFIRSKIKSNLKGRNQVVQGLFTKLNQSNNERPSTEVNVEDVNTVMTEALTYVKCLASNKSKCALTKHLNVKHQTVIIGAKPGRPNTGGSIAFYIRRQQK